MEKILHFHHEYGNTRFPHAKYYSKILAQIHTHFCMHMNVHLSGCAGVCCSLKHTHTPFFPLGPEPDYSTSSKTGATLAVVHVRLRGGTALVYV